MDFSEELNEFICRIRNLKAKIKTEEATKTSMIMPFFSMLGYDVFNPLEFVPEYTADVGIKKGEKVDYAIVDKKQNPIILIEAKCCSENLEKHGSQLFRYFATTSAKFGILTNGLIYQFYTDLDSQNKMDKNPFLIVNLMSLKDNAISDLQKFRKSDFKIDSILARATELKYNDQIQKFLQQQLKNPTDDFISYIVSNIYQGRKTQRVIEDFRPIVKKAFLQMVNDKASERLQTALQNDEVIHQPKRKSDKKSENIQPNETEKNLEPQYTQDEIESFFVIKTLLHDSLGDSHLNYEHDEGNLKIFLADNAEKWICKINMPEEKLYLNMPSNDKAYTKRQIRSPEDIYFYRNALCQILKNILG